MIVYRLIPNITQLENSLNSFAGVLDADEVLLFERATFLVSSVCRYQQYKWIHACISIPYNTVYCKLFKVEKFRGWTRYFKFAGKLLRFVHPGQNVLTCVDYAISLIECICLIILNNYIYHLTCCFLTLADMAKQCDCKIVSSWKSHSVA